MIEELDKIYPAAQGLTFEDQWRDGAKDPGNFGWEELNKSAKANGARNFFKAWGAFKEVRKTPDTLLHAYLPQGPPTDGAHTAARSRYFPELIVQSDKIDTVLAAVVSCQLVQAATCSLQTDEHGQLESRADLLQDQKEDLADEGIPLDGDVASVFWYKVNSITVSGE